MKVQAQRKFAQGAFIPSSGVAVPSADRRPEPAPPPKSAPLQVTLNPMKVTDLLDRVSLRTLKLPCTDACRAAGNLGIHFHLTPIVILQRMAGTSPEENAPITTDINISDLRPIDIRASRLPPPLGLPRNAQSPEPQEQQEQTAPAHINPPPAIDLMRLRSQSVSYTLKKRTVRKIPRSTVPKNQPNRTNNKTNDVPNNETNNETNTQPNNKCNNPPSIKTPTSVDMSDAEDDKPLEYFARLKPTPRTGDTLSNCIAKRVMAKHCKTRSTVNYYDGEDFMSTDNPLLAPLYRSETSDSPSWVPGDAAPKTPRKRTTAARGRRSQPSKSKMPKKQAKKRRSNVDGENSDDMTSQDEFGAEAVVIAPAAVKGKRGRKPKKIEDASIPSVVQKKRKRNSPPPPRPAQRTRAAAGKNLIHLSEDFVLDAWQHSFSSEVKPKSPLKTYPSGKKTAQSPGKKTVTSPAKKTVEKNVDTIQPQASASSKTKAVKGKTFKGCHVKSTNRDFATSVIDVPIAGPSGIQHRDSNVVIISDQILKPADYPAGNTTLASGKRALVALNSVDNQSRLDTKPLSTDRNRLLITSPSSAPLTNDQLTVSDIPKDPALNSANPVSVPVNKPSEALDHGFRVPAPPARKIDNPTTNADGKVSQHVGEVSRNDKIPSCTEISDPNLRLKLSLPNEYTQKRDSVLPTSVRPSTSQTVVTSDVKVINHVEPDLTSASSLSNTQIQVPKQEPALDSKIIAVNEREKPSSEQASTTNQVDIIPTEGQGQMINDSSSLVGVHCTPILAQNMPSKQCLQTPVLKQALQSPVLEQVLQTPLIEQVVPTPALQQAAQTPVLEQVLQNPVLQQVLQTPVLQQVLQTPVYKQVLQSPVLEQVLQTPALQQVLQTPLLEQVLQGPVLEQVGQSSDIRIENYTDGSTWEQTNVTDQRPRSPLWSRKESSKFPSAPPQASSSTTPVDNLFDDEDSDDINLKDSQDLECISVHSSVSADASIISSDDVETEPKESQGNKKQRSQKKPRPEKAAPRSSNCSSTCILGSVPVARHASSGRHSNTSAVPGCSGWYHRPGPTCVHCPDSAIPAPTGYFYRSETSCIHCPDPAAHCSSRPRTEPAAHVSTSGRHRTEPTAHGFSSGRHRPEPIAHGSSSGRLRPERTSNPAPDPEINPDNGVLEAPVFYPTASEFQNPMAYIENIMRTNSTRFGLCKIVPPTGFKPSCHLSNDLDFTVSNQYISRLYNRWGPVSREFCAIKAHLATQSVRFTRAPLLGGVEVNLPKLYRAVQRHGGIKKVIDLKRWGRVMDEMRFVCGNNSKKRIDRMYCKYLLPYDTLTSRERQDILNEVEQLWIRRNRKMLSRARNPLHRQKKLLGESDSSEDEDSNDRDNVKFALTEAEDCVLKGRVFNLHTYKKTADSLKRMVFGEGVRPTVKQVEQQYWELVLKGKEHVCTCSASIDTGFEGFGFTKNRNAAYGRHPWNLKVLSANQSNVLRSLGPVVGVTSPALHLGMVLSTSCWHRDPHGLPWIEYMHSGPPKIWYGISNEQSSVFKNAVAKLCPTSCQNKSIWLPSDITMIPPSLLRRESVSLARVEQRPGEFIVVFPKGYSSSICTGYTVSESVYFATSSWLENVIQIFQHELRESCEPTMFSLEQLLIAVAQDLSAPPHILPAAFSSLKEIVQQESSRRNLLTNAGVPVKYETGRNNSRAGAWGERDDEECDICCSSLYLSMVVGMTGMASKVCLQHALRLLERGRVDDIQATSLVIYLKEKTLLNILDVLESRLPGA